MTTQEETIEMIERSEGQEPQKRKIILLKNSIFYSQDYTFILCEEASFRLISIKKNRVFVDNIYDTSRGAKIAFWRFFKNKAMIKNLTPDWVGPYAVDHDWITERLEITEKYRVEEQEAKTLE